jgi:hypothetical protein
MVLALDFFGRWMPGCEGATGVVVGNPAEEIASGAGGEWDGTERNPPPPSHYALVATLYTMVVPGSLMRHSPNYPS